MLNIYLLLVVVVQAFLWVPTSLAAEQAVF
jgi:hypothetical protein